MTDDYGTPAPTLAMIRDNLCRVEQRIQSACGAAGRDRNQVTLVAVTKGRGLDEIRAACACGLCDLGENRIEELESKRPLVEQALAPELPTWHMIGHIQSRKADRVAANVALIHSVDSIALAQRLDRFGQSREARVRVLLQVNVSGEDTKSGFPVTTDAQIGAFLASVDALAGLSHLQIEGLMTIAPLAQQPEDTRPVFRQTQMLRDRLRSAFPFSRWDALSMGMSDDFEIAIQEGATLVRIGRALFEPHDSK
ncbi:MAG: YggS family pyridoxal phosphate-dependent enzyme [Anaerolineae bacterium]